MIVSGETRACWNTIVIIIPGNSFWNLKCLFNKPQIVLLIHIQYKIKIEHLCKISTKQSNVTRNWRRHCTRRHCTRVVPMVHADLLSPMWSRIFVRNDPITDIVMRLMSCLFILVLFLSVMEIFQLHKHVTFKKHPWSKYNKQVYCLSPRHGWKIPQIIKTIYMYIITLKQPSVVVKKRYFISVHSS